ncbi:TetR/AcrR family transcriptional regulator [Granulicella sp. dw_53]|uniref:TetR/AcrR family transcriptional regulator n=1 Tax=Granulicella sp. dw_53 TaxID=2719792 RepID=UPI001BD2BC19|nr:TetR/AcrR family transcriptional regulator [Granulicella sp. dw_53]
MARPKEFECEQALQKAINAFAARGFEGTSTDALLQTMGISRQSLYDTFGDKRNLYLNALRRYTTDSVGSQIRELNSSPSAFEGLEALMRFVVSQALADPEPRCLGLSAVSEFGRSDSEVAAITDTVSKSFLSALKWRISEAKATGEISKDVSPQTGAEFIAAALTGIKIAARAGATAETLRGIARMTLRGLT